MSLLKRDDKIAQYPYKENMMRRLNAIRSSGGEPVLRLLQLMMTARDYDREASHNYLKDIGWRFGAGYEKTPYILEEALNYAKLQILQGITYTIKQMHDVIIYIDRMSGEGSPMDVIVTPLKKQNEELKQKVAKMYNKEHEYINEIRQLTKEVKDYKDAPRVESAFNAVNGKPCFTNAQMGILLYAVGRLIEKPKSPGKTTIGEIVENISGYSAKTVSQNMKGEFRKGDIDAVADAIESKFPNLAAEIRHL